MNTSRDFDMDDERKPDESNASLIACCLSLAIAFTILKLLGMLMFPWWLVLMPIWLPIALCGLGYIVFWIGIGYICLIVHLETKDEDKDA